MTYSTVIDVDQFPLTKQMDAWHNPIPHIDIGLFTGTQTHQSVLPLAGFQYLGLEDCPLRAYGNTQITAVTGIGMDTQRVITDQPCPLGTDIDTGTATGVYKQRVNTPFTNHLRRDQLL